MSGDLPGSAALSLVSKVASLDPQEAVFRAMLAGWSDQQRAVKSMDVVYDVVV